MSCHCLALRLLVCLSALAGICDLLLAGSILPPTPTAYNHDSVFAVVRSGSQVLAFWSADPSLQRWQQTVAIQLPEGWEAYNTDVTPAEQVGKTTVDAPSAGVFVAVLLRCLLSLP